MVSDRTKKLLIEQKSYQKDKTPIFVAKTGNCDIFVAKIYDYALINSL